MNTEKSHSGGGAPAMIARILIIVEAAALVLTCLVLNNILPMKYLGIVIGGSVLLIALQVILVSGGKSLKTRSIFSLILSIVVIAAAVFVVFFIRNTENKLHQVTETAKVEQQQAAGSTAVKRVVSSMNVYVRKTDGYTDLGQLQGKTFGVLDRMDDENVALALAQLQEEYNEAPIESRFVGIMPLINSLRDGDTDAILVNTGFETAISDNDSSFKDWAELLCKLDVTQSVDDGEDAAETSAVVPAARTAPSVKPVEDVTGESFLVYLTGMDTRGEEIVADVGNSDVNMVIAVNPNTKKVLLINIPRDYYYYLWGDTNYPDKITHCGYYGVDCSIQTMNSLFGIDLNYYVKVGFNSVINVVNALGGITVNSDYEFELEGYYFSAGENYLDGNAALQFSRERMSLPGGDRARGMNQQKVISAIIQKVTSPDMITHFNEVLNAVTQYVVTNISVEDMEAVVKMQLDDGASWEVESIQVDGAGAWDYCYSLGDANDVMVPDWSTVDNAKAKIQEVLSGN